MGKNPARKILWPNAQGGSRSFNIAHPPLNPCLPVEPSQSTTGTVAMRGLAASRSIPPSMHADISEGSAPKLARVHEVGNIQPAPKPNEFQKRHAQPTNLSIPTLRLAPNSIVDLTEDSSPSPPSSRHSSPDENMIDYQTHRPQQQHQEVRRAPLAQISNQVSNRNPNQQKSMPKGVAMHSQPRPNYDGTAEADNDYNPHQEPRVASAYNQSNNHPFGSQAHIGLGTFTHRPMYQLEFGVQNSRHIPYREEQQQQQPQQYRRRRNRSRRGKRIYPGFNPNSIPLPDKYFPLGHAAPAAGSLNMIDDVSLPRSSEKSIVSGADSHPPHSSSRRRPWSFAKYGLLSHGDMNIDIEDSYFDFMPGLEPDNGGPSSSPYNPPTPRTNSFVPAPRKRSPSGSVYGEDIPQSKKRLTRDISNISLSSAPISPKQLRKRRQSAHFEGNYDDTIINSIEDEASQASIIPVSAVQGRAVSSGRSSHRKHGSSTSPTPIVTARANRECHSRRRIPDSEEPSDCEFSHGHGTASRENGDKEYPVRRILGEKFGGDLHKFLVDWEDCEGKSWAPSWVPLESCNCPEKIADFRESERLDFVAALGEDRADMMQRLAEVGMYILDNFKFPKIKGWRFTRRDAVSARFQAPGMGNSVVEKVRLQLPRGPRENTAIPPQRHLPDASGPAEEFLEDEVVYIRTEILQRPYALQHAVPGFKREDSEKPLPDLSEPSMPDADAGLVPDGELERENSASLSPYSSEPWMPLGDADAVPDADLEGREMKLRTMDNATRETDRLEMRDRERAVLKAAWKREKKERRAIKAQWKKEQLGRDNCPAAKVADEAVVRKLEKRKRKQEKKEREEAERRKRKAERKKQKDERKAAEKEKFDAEEAAKYHQRLAASLIGTVLHQNSTNIDVDTARVLVFREKKKTDQKKASNKSNSAPAPALILPVDSIPSPPPEGTSVASNVAPVPVVLPTTSKPPPTMITFVDTMAAPASLRAKQPPPTGRPSATSNFTLQSLPIPIIKPPNERSPVNSCPASTLAPKTKKPPSPTKQSINCGANPNRPPIVGKQSSTARSGVDIQQPGSGKDIASLREGEKKRKAREKQLPDVQPHFQNGMGQRHAQMLMGTVDTALAAGRQRTPLHDGWCPINCGHPSHQQAGNS